MSARLYFAETVKQFSVSRIKSNTGVIHDLNFGSGLSGLNAPWMYLGRDEALDLVAQLQASLRAEASEAAIANGKALGDELYPEGFPAAPADTLGAWGSTAVLDAVRQAVTE